ncbi:MAG TPA: protoheme IX farnesyltransferase [Syntrophales bacterium]|nr:protoheme IX farnesyltransferase [Syntrophales bacterium]
MTLRKTLRCSLCLCKAKISLFASLSAAMGFVLAAGDAAGFFCALCAGVFLLSCGACALNQYQERDLDARMARTAKRPIPSGRIRPENALAIALLLLLAGEGLLLFTGTAIVPLLGVAAVLWYNVLYTGLKKKSAFAVVPGALVGAIPPAMGWAAGGGSMADPALASLAFFFFIWQVPHFWLHLLSYGEDYRAAGLPALSDVFVDAQLKRLTFQWVAATAVSALLLGLCGLMQSPLAKIFLFVVSLWPVSEGITLLIRGEASHSKIFRHINYYMLLVMTLAFLDRLPDAIVRTLSFL